MRAQQQFAIVLGTLVCACASAPRPAPAVAPDPGSAAAPRDAYATHPPAASPRRLDARADFADLVRTARALIRDRKGDSDAPCLLQRDDAGYVLGADLMPAIDELPEPPPALGSRLERSEDTIGVLTAWGTIGRGESQFVLAAFTALPPSAVHAPAVALVLTDAGVYVRYGATRATEADGPVPIEAAIARLVAEPGNADATLFVSAEAALPLAYIERLLRRLPSQNPVALAVALPAGTALPAPAATSADAERCPDGLPELPADASEGDLPAPVIKDALAPLTSAAQSCLDSALGNARAGGRMALALRIAPDGSVQQACVQDDEIGDAALAACVLSSARSLRFPRPDPPGTVDVRLPLSLAPGSRPLQRAMCE